MLYALTDCIKSKAADFNEAKQNRYDFVVSPSGRMFAVEKSEPVAIYAAVPNTMRAHAEGKFNIVFRDEACTLLQLVEGKIAFEHGCRIVIIDAKTGYFDLSVEEVDRRINVAGNLDLKLSLTYSNGKYSIKPEEWTFANKLTDDKPEDLPAIL